MFSKPITLNCFFENNPNLKNYILSVIKQCGNPNGCSLDSYIIKSEFSIFIYTDFSHRDETYAVVAIYTDEKMRSLGSAKNILENLPSLGTLYFDTYSEPLIHLLKKVGGYEEEVFSGKPSKQFILDT